MPTFKTFDGVELFYATQGTGTPVLCLAGLSRNSLDFTHVAPTLSDQMMITMDYRGRGQSAWADDTTYIIPTEARDALCLLDHLGIDQAAILGTSRGGLIAMVIAATAPDRLFGIALNDIGPVIDPAGLAHIDSYIGRTPNWGNLSEAAVGLSHTQGFPDVGLPRWREEASFRFKETKSGLILRYDPRLADAVRRAGTQPVPDLWPFFEAAATLPLALIRGTNSNILSHATATEMAARAPDMIWAEVPDRGHVPFLDEPQATEALRTWLETL